MKRYRQWWQTLTIKKKITSFTGAIFVVCILSIAMVGWVIKFALVNLRFIFEENAQSIRLVQALEEEVRVFESWVQHAEGVNEDALATATRESETAILEFPYDYEMIGEQRYVLVSAIRNSYEVYGERRDNFYGMSRTNQNYVRELYSIYDMQKYMVTYANELMTATLEAGNEVYRVVIPQMLLIPWLAIGFSLCIFAALWKLSDMMHKSLMTPIMKLADTSRKIAENDFFVEDVQIENRDELGDFVKAFNKMKFATGEYITALEEKRKTLDLLHEEELEKLAVEKQLEIIKLELLKSQVNPHFLFNTLNVISGIANLEDAPTTEKMIKTLSSLFRYNLKNTDLEVPLARELKVVADYMYLQQMRFGERVSYDISCLVNEDRVVVPAFTFQPLVENCILHGLAQKEEGGCIRIRIHMRGSNLHIYVGDTGIGMTPEKLEALRNNLREHVSREEGRVGIGVGNIYQRIYAMYAGGEMEIFSKYTKGTVIRIIVPQMSGEGNVSSVDSR